MRIVILSPFYPFRGGLAQLNALLYTGLSQHNEVAAFTFTTLYPKILFPGTTQFVTSDDSPITVESKRILSSINPLSYFRTASAINKYAPDLLIIPYWMSFLAPAFGTVIRFLNKNIKIVSLVHNAISHEKKPFEKSLAKYFLEKCDAYIIMSQPVYNDLQKLVKNKNILLQPHPIYEQFSQPISKNDACSELKIKFDKKNILFFGLIRDYKGLDLLIEAMNSLDESYQLIIAGECYGDFGKYQSLIDKSPMKGNIAVFSHYITDPEVPVFFSAADVLVLPYRSATQSGVIATAYQMETPLISTNVGSLGTTIKEAETGIVTAAISSQAIAESIHNFFSDTEKIAVYKQNIKLQKEGLSWPNFIKSIETFFSQLTNK